MSGNECTVAFVQRMKETEIPHLFCSFIIENVQLASDVEAHSVVVTVGIRWRVADKRYPHRSVGLHVVADAVRPRVRGQREQLVDAFPGDELRLELFLATAVQAHGHDARRTVTVGRRVHTGRASVTFRLVSCGTHSTLSITTGRDKTRTSTTNTRGTSRPGDLSITDGWNLSNNNYRAVVSTCHVPWADRQLRPSDWRHCLRHRAA